MSLALGISASFLFELRGASAKRMGNPGRGNSAHDCQDDRHFDALPDVVYPTLLDLLGADE